LDLEKAGVEYDAATGIRIDQCLHTSNENIFAIGDVTGEFLLVHVAIYQGEVAARNAYAGTQERADYRVVSAHTVFCDPQIARVGSSEKSLLSAKVPYVVGRYDFSDHGKAMCLGKTRGFVKMMASRKNGEIIGATCAGPQASELIHEVIVAMHYHATVQDFMRIPHLHPTLAEIWTYPAEECAAQLGMKRPGDEQVEVATSSSASV
jgi:pyruvate/2-oxoglutarate dehydrogenase complex dihydrolipoamide dehydrogenase (E3) component